MASIPKFTRKFVNLENVSANFLNISFENIWESNRRFLHYTNNSLVAWRSACWTRKQATAATLAGMLSDWLITGQVLPTNPAAAVRGPKQW